MVLSHYVKGYNLERQVDFYKETKYSDDIKVIQLKRRRRKSIPNLENNVIESLNKLDKTNVA